MPARNNQTYRRQFRLAPRLVRFQKNRMNVPFKMIHRHEWFPQRLRQRFSVCNSNEQRADQSRPLCHANRIHVRERQSRPRQGLAHHRHDLPQMLARSQLRHHAAIFPVNIDLRRNHAGQNLSPVGDHRRRRFIARRFNPQNFQTHFLPSGISPCVQIIVAHHRVALSKPLSAARFAARGITALVD